MTTFCPLHSSLPKEIYTFPTFYREAFKDQLCTSLMKRPALFHSLPAFHFCLILGRGESTPPPTKHENTTHTNNSFLQTGRRELDLQTARRKRTDARQEGREKKEKEMTKGVQCSRRKTLKLFYLDRKVDVPPASLFLDWFWFVAFISIIVSHGWLGCICLLWLIIVIIWGRFIQLLIKGAFCGVGGAPGRAAAPRAAATAAASAGDPEVPAAPRCSDALAGRCRRLLGPWLRRGSGLPPPGCQSVPGHGCLSGRLSLSPAAHRGLAAVPRSALGAAPRGGPSATLGPASEAGTFSRSSAPASPSFCHSAPPAASLGQRRASAGRAREAATRSPSRLRPLPLPPSLCVPVSASPVV